MWTGPECHNTAMYMLGMYRSSEGGPPTSTTSAVLNEWT